MKNKSLSEYSSDSQLPDSHSPLIPPDYKQTEVGVIPEDWNVQSLGNIVRIIGGGAFKSQDAMQVGVRWLKIANVGINEILWNEESFLPEQFALKFNSFLLKEGDYVLALTRPILGGVLKIAQIRHKDEPALLNQRVGKLESIDGNDLGFLYFLFQKESSVSSIQQSMAGTDPPNLSTRRVYSITCATPPTKAEQEAIAGVLSDADALIESLEQLITKKRHLKQGAMQELLTGKKRLPGFEIKPGYKQTEVGVIPEDWDISRLIECTDYVDYRGKTPTKSSSGVLLVTAKNIRFGFIDYEISQEYIAETEYESAMRRGKPCIGDVLITTEAPLGMVAMVDRDNIALAQRVIKYRGKINKILSNYLKFYLLSSKFQTILDENSSGSTAKGIKGSILHQLPVILPHLAEQEAISTILSDMDAEIDALETKLAKTRQLKQGMMQELLTGRIRLV